MCAKKLTRRKSEFICTHVCMCGCVWMCKEMNNKSESIHTHAHTYVCVCVCVCKLMDKTTN